MVSVKVKACDITNEQQLRNTLDTMYQKAKEDDEPFYNLVELMCHEQTILAALSNIKDNKGSKTAGIDGKDIDFYLQMPYDKLVDEVRNAIQSYNPMPVRRKYIEKANGKLRPLGIPAMMDRIIQEIVRTTIEPIAEAKFYQYSFGFRPMRSGDQAMGEIIERVRRNKTYWVIEGDIKGFFDNINHNKLINMLWKIGVKDKRVLAMIKKMLKSGVIEEDGRLYPSDLGSPQGGILSPLLANIYLNFFDWMIADRFLEHPYKYEAYRKYSKDVADRAWANNVKKRHKECFLIRYADDWVILCKTEDQAKLILGEVGKYFDHCLKIELSKEKTFITNILEDRATFLGFDFFAEKSRTSENTVGKIIPNVEKANKKVKEIGLLIRDINRMREKNTRDIALQIEKVNSKIVGLAQYYAIANCAKLFNAWDNRLNHQQYKTWYRLSGGEWRFKKNTIPANETDNRRPRHEKRRDRLYYVTADNAKIAITKFAMTTSRKALRVNLQLSPYTPEGRKIYETNTQKLLPLIKSDSLFTYDELKMWVGTMKTGTMNPIYNFEYFMNREYIFNRDKGLCSCCGSKLNPKRFNCHHKNPKLPLEKVNKSSNLTSVCIGCHKLIHNHDDVRKLYIKKIADKIVKLKELLNKTPKKSKAM